MSSLAAATLDDVLDVTAASIRRAAAAENAADRRAHARLAASQLEWLRQVRLKSGPAVTLVDLSRGGALIDSRVQMRPGSTITLELSAHDASLALSSQVLRCQLTQIGSGSAIYRGACRFSDPLVVEDLKHLVIAPPAQAATIEPHAATGASPAAWQKIVVRYRDGGTLKGYTLDFHPSRGHFSLWPSVNATRSERVIVPLTRLKALFFVKEFAGDPTRDKRHEACDQTAAGRRIEVTFVDREVIRGTTFSYRPDGTGFFLTPFDTSGNNQRVFVVTAAVRHVRFP